MCHESSQLNTSQRCAACTYNQPIEHKSNGVLPAPAPAPRQRAISEGRCRLRRLYDTLSTAAGVALGDGGGSRPIAQSPNRPVAAMQSRTSRCRQPTSTRCASLWLRQERRALQPEGRPCVTPRLEPRWRGERQRKGSFRALAGRCAQAVAESDGILRDEGVHQPGREDSTSIHLCGHRPTRATCVCAGNKRRGALEMTASACTCADHRRGACLAFAYTRASRMTASSMTKKRADGRAGLGMWVGMGAIGTCCVKVKLVTEGRCMTGCT